MCARSALFKRLGARSASPTAWIHWQLALAALFNRPRTLEAMMCTQPALVNTRQAPMSPTWEKVDREVHTPSTVCPTPRTPSLLALPPAALELGNSSSDFGDVQPFWWPMAEGDEGVLSSPFDEPTRGIVNLSASAAWGSSLGNI